MGQWRADGAHLALLRRIQAHHRGALGQAVAFINRQPQRIGTFQQLCRYAPTADGDKAQGIGDWHAPLSRRHQRQQQLRQQNKAMGLHTIQAAEETRQIKLTGALEAHLSHRQQLDSRTGQQRRINPGDVLQQGGQRQYTQMPFDLAWHAGLPQAARHGQLHLGIQADALGLSGGAGGVGNFYCARRQLGHHRQTALSNLRRNRSEAQGSKSRGIGGNQAVDASTVEHVTLLSGREETGHRHTDNARDQCSQIPKHPLQAIIQRQAQAFRTNLTQPMSTRTYFVQELRIAQLLTRLHQGHTLAMLSQGLQQ